MAALGSWDDPAHLEAYMAAAARARGQGEGCDDAVDYSNVSIAVAGKELFHLVIELWVV